MTSLPKSDLGVNDRFCLKWWKIDETSLSSITPIHDPKTAVCIVSFSEMELTAIRGWLHQNQWQAVPGLISNYSDSDVGGFDNKEISILMHEYLFWSFNNLLSAIPPRTHAVRIWSDDDTLFEYFRKLEWEINIKVFSEKWTNNVIISGSEEHIFEIIMSLPQGIVYERVDSE